MSLLKLREYQQECLTAFADRWREGGATAPRLAGVLPTGAGKTVIFAHMSERHLAERPGERVVILVHTDELVQQAAAKVRAVAPGRTVGIVKAERNEVHAQVIVASVQSLRSAARRAQLRSVGLVIVDECHHATAKTYLTILTDLGGFDGRCRVAGFTATLVRADKAKLSEVWEDVAYRRDIAYMIRRGYLLDVIGKQVHVPDFDLTAVRTSGGDYQEGALGEALEQSLAPETVARAYLEHAADRQGLIFAPTVHSAQVFADAFNAEGIKTEVVHGGLARDERRAIIRRLEDGVTQVVSNCMVLTEGFDNPKVSCVVVARPTKSAGLYQQMVGRVLRPDLTLPAEQRGRALILDVVGAGRTHDLRSLVDLSAREDLPEDLDTEGLSLLELEDLQPEQVPVIEDLIAENYWTGAVAVTDFDPLLRDSARAWKRTDAGTYFLSAGPDAYVFITHGREPGSWSVAWCSSKLSKRIGGKVGGWTEHQDMPLDMAFSWAEEVIDDLGGDWGAMLADKGRAWRGKRASLKQVAMARSLGIDVPMKPDSRQNLDDEFETGQRMVPAIKAGELSDQIDTVLASRRIDPVVAALMAMEDRG